MTTQIHPTAIVDKGSEIGKNTIIHPYTVIGHNVKIGENCEIGPMVHIHKNTTIGNNNKLDSFVSIAGEPQDLRFKDQTTYVEIGDNNIFREYTHINRGTDEGSKTKIGSNCYFMGGVHVGHNSKVDDYVILVNSCALGGYTEIGRRVFLSASTAVHQFVKIGAYCMIAPLTKPAQDIPPFTMCIGASNAVVVGLNSVGLRRAGLTLEERNLIKKIYKIFYRQKLPRKEAMEKIRQLGDSWVIAEWVDFINNSTRGIMRYGSHTED